MLKTGRLSRSDSLEVFRLQGLSYYSVADMPGALHCFISILNINKDYQLQPHDNPPKVIDFFEAIRLNLLKSDSGNGARQKEINVSDQTETPLQTMIDSEPQYLNKAIGYSLLLPGLGHIQTGDTPKGWILLTSGLLALGSSVYFAIDTERKEDAYLAATIKDEIKTKYNDYNQAYKIRNVSLILFTSVWIYTQLDLLYWSKPYQKKISFQPVYTPSGYTCLTVHIQF